MSKPDAGKIGLNLKINYIHAERLCEELPSQLQVNFQLTLPSGKIVKEGNTLHVPFTLSLSTTPPTVLVSMKGLVVITGDEKVVEKIEREFKEKKASPVTPLAIQHLMMETLIVMKVLGLPPLLIPPIPPPQQVKVSGKQPPHMIL